MATTTYIAHSQPMSQQIMGLVPILQQPTPHVSTFFGRFSPYLRLSISRSGSGLCPTRNRPDQIEWMESQPIIDRKDDRIGRVETPIEFGRVGRGRKSGKQRESVIDPARIRHENGEKRPKSLMSHQIRSNLGHFRQDLG